VPRDPRIVETETPYESNEPFRYAALSHMWGDVESAPPLRAIRSNYNDLKNGIPLGRLPRNFADAVETCRRLSIKYIWIDSLCIIQDSIDDWKTEAATMHLVYKNALITITA
jgi:Heterokaryon incompatibility protein (HET)